MPNTIADNLARLQTARTDIANAITTMGGTVTSGDGFEEFPADIATIPSGDETKNIQLPIPKSILNVPKFSNNWSQKTWTGYTSFYGGRIWTDGTDIYYNGLDTFQGILDKATSTWSRKTWTEPDSLIGNYIWTDGTNIYYSAGSSNQYVLDKLSAVTPTTKCVPGYIG